MMSISDLSLCHLTEEMKVLMWNSAMIRKGISSKLLTDEVSIAWKNMWGAHPLLMTRMYQFHPSWDCQVQKCFPLIGL